MQKVKLSFSGLILSLLIMMSCSMPDPGTISGELKQWHKISLTINGPQANETDTLPNPFTDYEMTVLFTHESGNPEYLVPGYFAADGNAAETSAESGNKWRAHLSPDKTGKWTYLVTFRLNGEKTEWDGISGSFSVAPTDKKGRDLRAKGRLEYINERYLKFSGNGEYFLKAGADAPETLLAFLDFDGTYSVKDKRNESLESQLSNLKTWEPHLKDWQEGDPSWQDGKGKGLIGAVNYLASTGCNAFSFLTYNTGGDGENVWPFVRHDDKLHYDCSKLDQWGIVFDHATTKGMFLHFKLQENENDDNFLNGEKTIEASLDGGELGPERKIYLKELIARYGHNLALNWNIGEENTQNTRQVEDMAGYIQNTDPYNHSVVLHSFPDEQDMRYKPLLGNKHALTGLSIQNSDVADTHHEAVKWINEAEKSGHSWVVAHDESGNARAGTPPDPDYPGMEKALKYVKENIPGLKVPSVDDIRAQVLWGNILAGGTGVEYYFGYNLPQNDLDAQDWRSRKKTWEYSAIALNFFKENQIPFWEMHNTDELAGNPDHDNSVYCFSKSGEIYLMYFPEGETPILNLEETVNKFTVSWFNPRTGGEPVNGFPESVKGGTAINVGNPPISDGKDWLVILKKQE